jgi:two-component system, chemotaxis family, response regulator PixG
MMNSIDLVRLLQDAAVSERSGELRISNNGVTWRLYLTGTQLHYADHSLQTLETLEQFVQQFGFESALPVRQKLNQSNPTIDVAIQQLQEQNYLTAEQAGQLFTAITEEAIELLSWLPQAESHWNEQSLPYVFYNIGSAWPVLIERMNQRCDTWKSLIPEIASPYQCPRCDNLIKLRESTSYGMLPMATLEMMVKLMQGVSLRQLAFLLRQDVLKLCQLLQPYIKHGALRLEGIQSGFTQLPNIPGAILSGYTTNTYSRNTYSRESISLSLNQPAAAKVYKVVCIDDSPTVLDTIQRYLGTDRFEVATVEDPMASLSALFDMKPDLILMDVSMPGIDGNRLCQILKRSSVFTNVPIIMVSGNTGMLDKEKARAAGATDYLTKPFTREELLALVEKHLSPVSV